MNQLTSPVRWRTPRDSLSSLGSVHRIPPPRDQSACWKLARQPHHIDSTSNSTTSKIITISEIIYLLAFLEDIGASFAYYSPRDRHGVDEDHVDITRDASEPHSLPDPHVLPALPPALAGLRWRAIGKGCVPPTNFSFP